jgi:hypothetical protein
MIKGAKLKKNKSNNILSHSIVVSLIFVIQDNFCLGKLFYLKNIYSRSLKKSDFFKSVKYRKTPHIVPRTDQTFLFFSGRYARDTMCNSVFFFQLFRVHFHTN